MLRAEPHSLFSWDLTLYEDGVPIAEIDLAWIREAGEMIIADVPCTMYREEMFGAFVLESGGFPLVRAVKPSAFFREFEVTYDEQLLRLKARSVFGRTFDLFQGDERLGEIKPDNVFTRKMTVDLPEAMPLAVQVFIVWLVVLMWKRAASSG